MDIKKAEQLAAQMRLVVPDSWTVRVALPTRVGFGQYKVVASGPGYLRITCSPKMGERFHIWGTLGVLYQGPDGAGFLDFQTAWDALVGAVTKQHTIAVKQLNNIS